jgi:hypothetical protein
MSSFLRNYITPLSLVAFAAVAVTGLMMWLGIRNHQLGELHEKFGILFAVVAVLHLIRNGKGFSFMIGQTRSLILVGVLGVVAMLLVGSALLSPGGERGPGGPQGGPRGFGPAAALTQRLALVPISQVAPALGMTSGQAITRLRKGGIVVDGPGQNLDSIARKAGMPMPRLLDLMLADETPNPEDNS